MPPERLQTLRLILRKPVIEDAQSLFDRYMSHPQIPYYMSWKAVTDLEQAKWWVNHCIQGWQECSNFEFTIEIDGQAVGMIGMEPLERGCGVGFGYVIAKPYWGKGYMTEALAYLSDWALEQKDVSRAEVFCHVNNVASKRVIEKSGFEFEGVVKAYYVFPNIAPEPQDCAMFSKVHYQ